MSNLFGAFHISFCFGHFYSGKRGSRRNFERDLTGQINYRRFVPRRFSSLENCIYNKNADSLFHESHFAIFVSKRNRNKICKYQFFFSRRRRRRATFARARLRPTKPKRKNRLLLLLLCLSFWLPSLSPTLSFSCLLSLSFSTHMLCGLPSFCEKERERERERESVLCNYIHYGQSVYLRVCAYQVLCTRIYMRRRLCCENVVF